MGWKGKLYYSLPKTLQMGIELAYDAIPIGRSRGTVYCKTHSLLEKAELWDKEKLQVYQFKELRKLLCHAYETTKFYKKRMDDVGFNPYTFSNLDEFSKIPSIDKRTVQENLKDMLSNAFVESDRVRMTTGGTTGKQLTFYEQKGYTLPRELAYYDYNWSKFGYIAGKSKKVMLRNHVLPKGKLWQYNPKTKELILDPFHLTNENCYKIIDKLNQEKIPFFHTYPSAILMLSDYMNCTGKKLTYIPKAIFATSENLYKGQREVIEKAFGCRLLMSYGHSERACLASECLLENHYHLQETYGYTELLDDNERVIKEPNQMGEITATGFNNYVFPLIRYKTADYASYAERHKCDYHGRILANVEGRWLQEMLVTALGNKISMTALNFHSSVFDRVRHYQFYQDTPGKVTMRIVKDDGYTENDEIAIYRAIKEKLGDAMQLDFAYIESVERTKNGKYRYIVSNIR